MTLAGRAIAVVGGDEREQEIARQAAAAGATVRAYGFPWPADGIAGVEPAETAGLAIRDADYILFPIPGIAADGSIFAPSAARPIRPGTELLAAAPKATIILGRADERLRAAAAQVGNRVLEYEDDRELMLLRGPAIVEGALGIAIERTDVTLHASRVCVVGQGTIGTLLTRALVLLGARTHAAARNPVQRAEAYTMGAEALPLDELETLAPRLAMLFSTVPTRVVGRDVLERLPSGALVMDLAAPPGGVDLDAARDLGHQAVHARGLGNRAPVTVGRSQWTGIHARIAQIEAANP